MSRQFVTRLRARYSECDMQGVVFNANYLSYFDLAITELWREAVGPYGDMTDGGVDMVVAEAGVRYLSPVRFDDEFEVVVEVVRLGNTAMSTRFAIERDGLRLAEGTLRHVFIDVASGAKTPIPAEIRRGLEPYLAADAEGVTG